MQFHAVHRQPNSERRTPSNRDIPWLVIARFVCRKDKDFVWSQREAIKKTENYKDEFFVPDLVKVLAEEGVKFREAVHCARKVFNLKENCNAKTS